MPADTVLDDIEARPGSTTSLLRTVVGLYLRRLGGEVSSAALVRLADDLGIAAGPARTAIARLKQKGLLLPAPGPGYALNPAAVRMLERGDRRIFQVRTMAPGDPWCLISATIPETRRDLRHQLRRRLQFLGAGAVSAGLWIVPGHLEAEVELLLEDLGARASATLFRTADPRPPRPLADAVGSWWDLHALRAEHLRFLASVRAHDGEPPFPAYVRLIDSWRVLPYIDPGLPAELLPDDWPGLRSAAAFTAVSARLAGPAWEHVRAVAG
ncbi:MULTISPECIES: PaaX family transcriptional regulator [Microbacterium]|uniref:PaaX family transcriptional regulator n=1 Tax=Microbacterium TaxID=33882 RepID=UPI00217EFE87|nr:MULTISPECIES: PaaX family transcriptional regulator C-terminal domain-containing protein [Microbacterium]UWF77263.1 regulator [Microbacterium neungamense]WCM55420.1 regulator [Microbacterium sp. EF45047]